MALGANVRYPLIVPRYKEKVEHSLGHNRFSQTSNLNFSRFPNVLPPRPYRQSFTRLTKVMPKAMAGV